MSGCRKWFVFSASSQEDGCGNQANRHLQARVAWRDALMGLPRIL